MKAPLVCILLLAAAGSIPALLAQQTPAPTPQTTAAEDAVRQVNAEEIQAFLQNDPKTMARLWSDEFVVTNPLNKFVNKSQVLGMVQSGFLVITSYDRHIDYVRMDGDFAIVAGTETVTWGGKMPNAGKTQQLRFTAVWKKQQQGQWQEIARHANIVPAP
jgi:ketosteroid isomerase-like protein